MNRNLAEIYTCPQCHLKNQDGMQSCDNCGCRLLATSKDHTRSLAPIAAILLPPEERNVIALHSTQKVLQLFIGGHTLSKVVNIPVDKTILLGRSPALKDLIYDDLVALDTYGAYEKGVSRAHALLRRNPNSLQIVDLDSRNGTFISGRRLKAFEPYILTDNDAIQLGQLTIKLSLETGGIWC